jgi:2-polyprenyl-6-methoxyphenol hydroxylase-like FAD-dependent oxidoreductase
VRVAIVGSGLAGLAAAVDLVDAGHQVDLYESPVYNSEHGQLQRIPRIPFTLYQCLGQPTSRAGAFETAALD